MPTVVTVLSNLVLLAGAGSLTYSFYLRKKEDYFQGLFTNLQKCQKYHLDYIEKVDQLPFDKNIVLFGTARSQTDDKIIAKTYIKKSIEQDRLWNYSLKNKFDMTTATNQLIEIQPSEGQGLLAFNLHKNNQDQKLEERIIHHNEPICAYGRITKMGETGRKLQPELLMGGKHQIILQYLDKQMLKLNGRAKYWIIVGTVLFGTHLVYHQIVKRLQTKTQVLPMVQEIE